MSIKYLTMMANGRCGTWLARERTEHTCERQIKLSFLSAFVSLRTSFTLTKVDIRIQSKSERRTEDKKD